MRACPHPRGADEGERIAKRKRVDYEECSLVTLQDRVRWAIGIIDDLPTMDDPDEMCACISDVYEVLAHGDLPDEGR